MRTNLKNFKIILNMENSNKETQSNIYLGSYFEINYLKKRINDAEKSGNFITAQYLKAEKLVKETKIAIMENKEEIIKKLYKAMEIYCEEVCPYKKDVERTPLTCVEGRDGCVWKGKNMAIEYLKKTKY